MCLGNVSENFTVDNMKKTGVNGHVHDFSVDYSTTGAGNIMDIYKYLIWNMI